ncbi:MAG: DUF2064 domain-containing protein [Actinomycetota bacterium]|nr:DUF2064 domain-containing protein [Actinomycetota bacterium]
MSLPTLLVVAKAPVAGHAKTRLTTLLSPEAAADLAAAALLDTLAAVADTPAACRVVAFTGELAQAQRRDELQQALEDFVVVAQRGTDFAARLVAAHTDAAAAAGATTGVLQIGMDTPQVSPALLNAAAAQLSTVDALLGPALDGGWWCLGVRRPELANALAGVPMSCADTGERTLAALRRAGASVQLLPELRDVDTPEDIVAVARAAAGTRFSAAVAGSSALALSR